MFKNPQPLPIPKTTCYNTITMKYATIYNQTQISCGNYKDITVSKIKQRTMKSRKTKSYQNRNSNNYTKQLQAHTQTEISVHTTTYPKTKNTQFWHGSTVGANNANSDKQSQKHVGRSERSDLRQVVKTDDNQVKQKIQYLKFFKIQKPIKNNP